MAASAAALAGGGTALDEFANHDRAARAAAAGPGARRREAARRRGADRPIGPGRRATPAAGGATGHRARAHASSRTGAPARPAPTRSGQRVHPDGLGRARPADSDVAAEHRHGRRLRWLHGKRLVRIRKQRVHALSNALA